MGFGGTLGTGEWLVIGLSVLIGFWFIAGNFLNNQRSEQTMHWLKKGLGVFGQPGRGQFSAPNPRGIRFKLEPPQQAPFKTMEGTLVLQRRENLPMWLFQFLRGKRDILILMADVKPALPGELRAFHQSNLAPVEAARRGETASLTFLCQEGDVHYYYRGESNPDQFQQISRLEKAYPGLFQEVSLQRKSPNLILQVRLSTLLRVPPNEFFQDLRQALN